MKMIKRFSCLEKIVPEVWAIKTININVFAFMLKKMHTLNTKIIAKVFTQILFYQEKSNYYNNEKIEHPTKLVKSENV